MAQFYRGSANPSGLIDTRGQTLSRLKRFEQKKAKSQAKQKLVWDNGQWRFK